MAILAGFRKENRYVKESEGYKKASYWTSSDTIDRSDNITNYEKALANTDSWDTHYDTANSQPNSLTDIITKLTSCFNNVKYLKNSIGNISPTNNVNNQINNLSTQIQNVRNLIYPVGSLYWSSSPTNPQSIFGGTWVQITDKFIVAAGSTYNTIGSNGGSATATFTPKGAVGDHTLTTSEMPSHNHHIPAIYGRTSEDGAHTHQYFTIVGYEYGASDPEGQAELIRSGYLDEEHPHETLESGTHAHDTCTFEADTLVSGGGGAHNHTFSGTAETISTIPPYEVYYCWKRTA